MRHPLVLTISLACLLVSSLVGCAEPAEETPETTQEAAPQRVENPDLGIALADVPDPFELVGNEADGIRLETKPHPEMSKGTVLVSVSEEQRAGINLVKGVQEQKEYLESQPEGKFLGQVELMGPTGTAYSTRGRYHQDGQNMEEIRLLALHPLQPEVNRMVSVKYVYEVSGDTKERLDHAMTVLGEVVPATQEEPEEPTDAPAEETTEDASAEPADS